MIDVDTETLSKCAELLLEDIVKNKSTKSQLKAKFMSKFSEGIIDAALTFLEDEEFIGSMKVEPLEYYSRITGYYQKVSGWNTGKLEEFRNRHRYATI